MNDTTAVKSRKRNMDGFTLHSSHSHCYAAGLHAATTAGREWCRNGDASKRSVAAVVKVQNVKSKISNVVHAVDGDSTLCAKKLAAPVLVDDADYPVTCKSCIRKSA